jgi:hypothetical protein
MNKRKLRVDGESWAWIFLLTSQSLEVMGASIFFINPAKG